MRNIIEQKVLELREYFNSGATRSITYRIEQLKRLRYSIISHQAEIESALWSDLRKSPEETYLTEIAILLQEVDLHISKLRKWGRPTKVKSPIHLFPSRSAIHYEPLGVVLVIAPWNYPFQLIINPLIGAIAAGCTVLLKPSPDAPETSQVVERVIRDAFDSSLVAVVQGGRAENMIVLEQRYDFIFFTGSPQFGRAVYEAAAKYLTPVILELGGKSPCIVDEDANIRVSARRIAWGKWINAGQTCIAPDYLFVHSSVKDELLREIVSECEKMYGKDASKSRFYPRIVTQNAFDRVSDLCKGEKIYYGGEVDRDDKYISPTIVDDVKAHSAIMGEEIFGPLLPVMTFQGIEEVISFVNGREKPLALYYFGENSNSVLDKTSSGGACVNDTIMHISNHNLPFGGVGNSGLGSYHGRESFLLFSNRKSVVTTPTWIDLPLKYPPFKYFNIIKRLI